MKVNEIMTSHPRTIAPDNTLVEAAGLMRELDVGALPVCDGDDLIGLVTDRDIVVRGIADGNDPASTRVSEAMSGGTEFVFADQEVEDAAHVMEQHQIRRLPVLNAEKRVIGIISIGDIATASNPAFTGLAIREISAPNRSSARRRRLEHETEPSRVGQMAGSRVRGGGPARGRTRSGARGHLSESDWARSSERSGTARRKSRRTRSAHSGGRRKAGRSRR